MTLWRHFTTDPGYHSTYAWYINLHCPRHVTPYIYFVATATTVHSCTTICPHGDLVWRQHKHRILPQYDVITERIPTFDVTIAKPISTDNIIVYRFTFIWRHIFQLWLFQIHDVIFRPIHISRRAYYKSQMATSVCVWRHSVTNMTSQYPSVT